MSGPASDAPLQHDQPQPAPVLLHGGTGADTAVFAQAAAAYTVQQHDGYELVTSAADPSQQVKLVNVENLQFSDGTVAVQNRDGLDAMAGLYTAILGRQADVDGFDFWGGLQANHVGLGDIALGMIGTAEGAAQGYTLNGQSVHDVDVLYHAIFNRAPDASGEAYWAGMMDSGALTLVGVANGFLASNEMNGHKLAAADWDFKV